MPNFSFGDVFTFLFLTLGPLKILGPFATMTRGRDATFKRQLAVQGIVIAVIALFAAATIGAKLLNKWGISVGALLMTAGVILFMVALRSVLEQYAPQSRPEAPATAAVDASPTTLAFSPLAFPTIVTPYGVAVLVLMVTFCQGHIAAVLQVLGVAGFVLVLDLLAMLSADRIFRTPFVAPVLGIVGAVLGVLQVALGVQAVMTGLRLLGALGAEHVTTP